MASTYEPIATSSPSGTGVVTFSSISSIYTDLVVVIAAINTAADDIFLNFNNDTGSNYSDVLLYGTGSVAGSGRHANTTAARIGYTANDSGVLIANIMNYSNTTTYKTVLSRSSRSSFEVDQFVNLWRSTAAISTVKVTANQNFSSGSKVTLYGIKAA